MADDINSYWFPHPDILRLAYQRNRSRFHGIDHVLRVWIYAMYIGRTYYADKIDLDVLSAASLFHDIGRRNDLKDPKHGIRSATWVNEILPALAPELVDSQIDMIKILCKLHQDRDGDLSTLELKILKDADALDRFRLPIGRIKKEFIRLPETHDLIEIAEEFHKEWAGRKKNEKDPFNTMIIALRNSERFKDLLPSQVKGRTEVLVTRSAFRSYLNKTENLLKELDRLSHALLTKLNLGVLRFRDLKQIRNLLKQLQEQVESSPSKELHEIFVQAAMVSVAENMRLGLADHTIHVALKNKYRKLYEQVSRDPRCDIEIPHGDLYQLVSIEASVSHPFIRRAVVEHLAFCREFQQLILLLAFTDLRSKRLFLESFGRRYRLYQRLRFSFPTEQVQWQRWLWVVAVERWIKSAVKLIEDGDIDRARHMLEYILKFIEQTMHKIELNISQLTELFSYLNDIIEIDKRHAKLGLDLDKHLDLWQRDFDILGGMNEFPGAQVNQNVDIFYLFDGNSLDSSRNLVKLERYLINLAQKGSNIDMVVRNYMLPAHLNREFKYSMSNELVELIKDTKIKDTVTTYIGKLKGVDEEKNIHDVTLDIVAEVSEGNLKKLLEPSKYRALVKAKKNYRILTNIPSLSILEKIVDNRSTLLSMWNIFSFNDRSFLVRQGYGSNYRRRTKYRGILQRHMLIRRPNISNDHTFYGTLQNLDDVFSNPGILGRIPTPTDLFTSRRYGDVVIVFKKEVVNRSIFLLLDSFWEHRNYPVAFEEAKYIYEKVKGDPLRTSFETNPMSILTSYVEANILHGVSLDDIDMVLLPEKMIKRKSRIIEKVKGSYPSIEFKGI